MRAFTCRSSRWPPQADSIKAANTMNPEGTVRLTMDVLVIDMRAMLHGGSLNIYFPGVDDLVLVGFGSLDGLALALLDLPELELDFFLCVLLDFHRLGLRLIADAARLHLVRSGSQAALRRLELAVDVRRCGMGRLLHGRGGIDHVHHGALQALLRHWLQIGVHQLDRAVYFGGTCRKQRCQHHRRNRGTVSSVHGSLFPLEKC